MNKTLLKYTLTSLGIILAIWSWIWIPQVTANNNLHIIPEITSENDKQEAIDDVKYVAGTGEKNKTTALTRYTEIAEKYEKNKDIAKSMQTWIMWWNTLIQYVVYVLRFLSQLGLLIGGIMMLYAGYLYATTIFEWGNPSKAKSAIKFAIIGILIIVFAYAILRGLVSLFL